jgi:hypothetical protein
MTLQQASDFSQIIGAISVVASLVFVGLQVRQNTRSQRLVAVNSLTAAAVAINAPGMESPFFGEALSQAMTDWETATREQRIVSHYFLFSFFKLAESAWYQRQVQVLDATQWAGWERLLLAFYHCDGIKFGWWRYRGDVYSPEFQIYLSGTSSSDSRSAALELIFSGQLPQSRYPD